MNWQAVASTLGLGLVLSPAPTLAAPVSYEIDFEVQYFGTGAIDPRVVIGDIYSGSFTVDDSILLSDGLNKAGLVSAFSITMEDVSWTMGLAPPGSLFSGFRGPLGLGASSPGFDVLGGTITNLRGGVFGESDIPYVDFSEDPRLPHPAGYPSCSDGTSYCGNSPNAFFTVNPLGAFGGSMTIAAPVPEPETYAMLLLGLGVVGFVSRRRLRDSS